MTLVDLLPLLRQHGVSSYADETTTITFFDRETTTPTQPPIEEKPGRTVVADVPDLCACGHSLHTQHSAAGCYEGCPVALCETGIT